MIPTRFIYPSPGFERYWNNGKGKQLLSEISHIPTKSEIEEKVPLLFECDHLADQIIEELYYGKGFQFANQLIDEILDKGIDQVENTPAYVQAFFSSFKALPDWLDESKLALGTQFCQRSGVLGMIVLRNYSLMGGYESAAINKPLIHTEALKKGAAKRIAETTEFWVNITGTNALDRQNNGFKHIIKVRLMHAYARVSIKKSGNWKVEDWGIPINTWDMVATNLGFSIIYLDGLRVLGINPSPEEEAGLFHFWKFVGFLLGIPAHLIPESRKEAIAEIYKWTITQPAADDDTKSLANALYLEPLSAEYLKRMWQRRLVLKINLGYNNYFLGRHTCQTIGIPYSSWRHYPKVVKFFTKLGNALQAKGERGRAKAAKSGRKKQEKIKDLLMAGHQSLV